MDGDQVADGDSLDEFFLGSAEGLGINGHGHTGGNALVAAAGKDDDGHFAAAHTGIGTGGSPSGSPAVIGSTLLVQNNGADIGAPVATEAFLGDGQVILQLAAHEFLHIGNIQHIGKFHDPLDAEASLIGQVILRGLLHGHFQFHNAVAADMDDIGVMVDDADTGGIFTCIECQVDIKYQVGLRRRNIDGNFPHILLQLSLLFTGDRSNDLQLLAGITGNHAGADGGSNTTQATGIGHHNALNILNDIAADQNIDPLRQHPQHLTGLGTGISQSDGLGAAHGRAQLFLQNSNELLI